LKCTICLQKPIGDYYQYRNEILCSSCFNFNWQWQEKFKRTFVVHLSWISSISISVCFFFRYLQAFQKVRDCSYIHNHAGTSAKIQVNSHITSYMLISVSFF